MHKLKRYFPALLLISLAFASHGGQPTNVEMDAQATAKAAIKNLAGALQAELKTAMQTGGPVAAIAVCNMQALPITAQVAAGHGLNLSRVSLKTRNPANAPNAWQTDVLQDFEKRRAAGEDVNQLTWSETADGGGAKEFRFMKAIPTGGVCLACHGTALSPDISRVLNELYPDDQATGFSEGDIRGAFVVTNTVSD